LVLLYPNREDLKRHLEGKDVKYLEFVSDLRARGIEVIDLLSAFPRGKHSIEELITNHYTPLGNRLVAEKISKKIKGQSYFDRK
jgi:hypothetical protein